MMNATSAVAMGYEEALSFLEDAPWLMMQAAKKGHVALAPPGD